MTTVTHRPAGIPLWFSMALMLMAWGGIAPQSQAQANTDPAQVVNQYLSSLAAGNTQVLSTLIDGRMKRKNRQLALDPASYGDFLRKHYSGVKMVVESITSRGDRVLAKVRFDYPASDSSLIELVLTQVGGRWKITDETY